MDTLIMDAELEGHWKRLCTPKLPRPSRGARRELLYVKVYLKPFISSTIADDLYCLIQTYYGKLWIEEREEITTVVRKRSGGFSIRPIVTRPSIVLIGLSRCIPFTWTTININSTDQRAKVFPISEAYLSGVILNPPRLRLYKVVNPPLTCAEHCIETPVLTRTGGSLFMSYLRVDSIKKAILSTGN
ncbi:hypothetical protein PCH_Pc04g00140 [Penicillium rubens Wisconsin 54-1255]|uniref:Uncharacterized protein n=1 Tax=Penicillium rubens (strain ATCC 28089 / DSM 1075 / NRRL 1951 / Wisconsin 54-1255) TaxID=500485 RepID=B6GVU0_PENRW|nr:hypothetical protein PCH_Pc04g00140 [Penicillium rubens Wisconsin 54-1255]